MLRRSGLPAPPVPILLALIVLGLAAPSGVAGAADPVRLVAADAAGVTLELTLGDWRLDPVGSHPAYAGRSLLVAPGLGGHGLPGRPVIPGASVLIALPPGAGASARLVEGAEEAREGVRLAPGERRGFTDDRAGLGIVPFAEPVPPIVDGPWPVAVVEAGVPFTLRGQRLVAIRILPFRYDEATARLWVRPRMRVRVEFTGVAGGTAGMAARPATGGDDRHWEPVLRAAVLNYQQGRGWRTAPGPQARRTSLFDRPPGDGTLFGRTTGPAGAARAQLFDESEPEVRVQLDSSAVYTVTYAQLAAKGYPAGVPVDQVSVHRHEFLEDQIPAYETIEIPVEVDEAAPANGVFDGNDRIVMYVQSWAERSGASLPQRHWGDGEVVYVTRVARPGLRVAPRDVGPGGALTPLPSYPWTQRWEGNYFHMPFPGAAPAETLFDQWHWTPYVQYYSPPDTFPFEVNDIDPAHDITFTVAWQGRRLGTPYYTWAWVRNVDDFRTTVADSVLWSGKANRIVTATFPGDRLSEGPTNGFIQRGRNGTGPPHPSTNAIANASLNWFEATYWRGYQALGGGYLPCNSGDAAGEYEIRAAGFASNAGLRVYDVTDPLDPRRLNGATIEPGGAWAVRFRDSTATGVPRRYIVFSEPRAVPAARITAVTRSQLAAGAGGDYLIVAPEAFAGPATTLAALRQANGLSVVTSPLQSVFDEFNGGRRSAWALKRYLRFALNQWQAKFVVLIGDGSEDPRNYSGASGPDIVPVARVAAPVSVGDGREVVPSDGWLVWCLNGCAPVGGVDPPILHELFIGRLPATTPQEAADMVDKLVRYDALSADQPWRNDLLLFSDDEYSSLTTFGGGGGSSQYCRRFYEDRFWRLNQTIRAAIVDSAGAGLKRTHVEHFDLNVWLAGIEPDANQCRPSEIEAQNYTRGLVTPELMTRLNAGRMWWNYQGHANEFVLAHENFYRNFPNEDDKGLLLNTDKPFLLSAFSCHVNAFGRVGERRTVTGPPIGEDLVLLPRRGAIASYASVGFEIIPDNGSDHLNVAWARAMFVDPPFDDLLGDGDTGARTILGESIALAYLRYVTTPAVQFDPTENGVALTYHLLGDPATRLSIGPPQVLVTANGDTVVSGRPVALSPPRDTLHLEADLVSTVELTSIALIEVTGGGPRTLADTDYTLTPPFPDTDPGGRGGRRFHLSYSAPLRPGTLGYTIRTVDRYGLATDFRIVFQFSSHLLASGNVLAENDAITPAAPLALRLELPTPLTDPQAQLSFMVDSIPQAFQAAPLDSVGREFLLTWSHPPYALGGHRVDVTVLDSLTRTHRFRVVDPALAENRLLRDVLAFPNPMDEQVGTTFSMYLISDGPADVVLRVFSVTGRLIYERVERDLGPGYHQWPWDGRDVRGDLLANGVFLFKVSARSDSRTDTVDGRLVKLRKPRRSASATP